MEKLCEFCRGLRPVVYCKADAALLCLYCDAKIHSANALFNRHHRTALCELCRCRPAYVKCLDHRMFMCNACDGSQHTSSSQHSQKHAISSYTGCPSAKDFEALWGLQLNELDNDDNAHLDQTLSTSCGSCDSSVVNLDNHGKSFSPIQGLAGAEYEVGSSSQPFLVSKGRKEHKITSFILHQIAGLKRFQPAEGSSASAESDLSSSSHHKRFDENHDQHIRLSQNMTNFHQRESLFHDLKVDSSPFQFTQPENLPTSSSPSTMCVLLQTESIWQCRSPVQSSQLWSQNMQDLGVCEELICRDDFNIPDIDLTFQNFDELFEGEQDHIRMLLDDKHVSNSAEKDMSVDKSDNCNSISMAEASEASSMSHNQPADLRTYADACDKVENILGSMDSNSSCPIQTSSSNFSFCTSRFSTISSTGPGNCHNSQPSSDSPDKEGGHYEVRVHSLTRYKEKKHSRLIN